MPLKDRKLLPQKLCIVCRRPFPGEKNGSITGLRSNIAVMRAVSSEVKRAYKKVNRSPGSFNQCI
ncbi:hypothetical protein SAMN05444410_10885 [Hydrobacter penzbergensis]|uniref:Uncharacterized protein n=1 Tax=Hydrobacter penzbergensis TaxID=1235997 RepID=A0A8X8IFM4_9BACT|nr:hypothetical protein SAMN05444410_10885 [Hydrobacter penzbergensis]